MTGPLLTLVIGKGGVGKTTVARGLAELAYTHAMTRPGSPGRLATES